MSSRSSPRVIKTHPLPETAIPHHPARSRMVPRKSRTVPNSTTAATATAAAAATTTTTSTATTATATKTAKTKTSKPRSSKNPRNKAPLIWSGIPQDKLDDNQTFPQGWHKETYGRVGSEGKSRDSYWFTPIKKYKLRSIADVKRFLNALPSCNGNEEEAIWHTNDFIKKKKRNQPDGTPQVAAPIKRVRQSPKRKSLSAYDLFCKSENERILKILTAENPSDPEINNPLFTDHIEPDELRKLQTDKGTIDPHEMNAFISARWKTLSADDRAKYNNLADAEPTKVAKKTTTKRKKDKDAPRKKVSAYNYFVKLEREKICRIVAANQADRHILNPVNSDDYIGPELLAQLQKKNEGRADFAQVGKLVGARWQSLTAAKRAMFETLAAQDAVRYAQEMQAYSAKKKNDIAKVAASTKDTVGGTKVLVTNAAKEKVPPATDNGDTTTPGGAKVPPTTDDTTTNETFQDAMSGMDLAQVIAEQMTGYYDCAQDDAKNNNSEHQV